jgi:8-hydroxy-5-deazaflavin:NADPH oxidoreductase
MKVALVGGTGKFGQALAAGLRSTDEVVIGSRDAGRAQEAGAALGVRGATNEQAVRGADLVVLATNADATVATARELSAAIGRTPVLCVASDLTAREPSLAEQVADVLEAPVAAGMHTLAARTVGREQDALVCGDDEAAKARALELAGRLARPVDAGPLSSARILEGLVGLLIVINKRYRTHAGIRLTGLP